jgi:hypothetical protein
LETALDPSNNRINTFLYTLQGLGVVFIGIFLAAYLAGLPTTAVFHSEPIVRLLLASFGIVLLVLVLIGVGLAIYKRRK